MTDQITATTELPYGGTVEDYRRELAKRGGVANEKFSALITADDKPLGRENAQLSILVSGAASDAWGLVAVLKWIEREHGIEAAFRAASIAQDVAMNGDPWDDSLLVVADEEQSGPLTADDMDGVYDGIAVASIGEDGALIALGHHDDDKLKAALNAYTTTFLGAEPLFGVDDDAEVRPLWAVRMTQAERAECGIDGWGVRWGDSQDPVNAATPGAFPVTVWEA